MWANGFAETIPMPNNCPQCGSAMEYEVHEVRLRTGTCPACSKEFALVEGETVASRLGSAPPSSGAEDEEGTEAGEGAATVEGPECEECGSPLSFHEGPRGTLEVRCDECETVAVFVPQTEAPSRGRPRADREGPGRETDSFAPRGGRPCRKCGNPIQLSTGEDGVVVGECTSCGNRFTLPPRRDGPGGGRRFDRRPRDDRSDFRRGPGARGGGRYPGPRRGPPRQFDDRDRRRKRRPSYDS
jgi:DNA-directed RNA polymerase subunit M/transcription elongation factor TFIIS